MTTRREYRCDICDELIEPPYGGAEAGYGIHFKMNKRGEFTFVKVRDAERHICVECAITIHEIVSRENK